MGVAAANNSEQPQHAPQLSHDLQKYLSSLRDLRGSVDTRIRDVLKSFNLPPLSPSQALWAKTIGILVLHVLQGVLQERIVNGVYGPNKVQFTSTSVLVFFNYSFIFAAGCGAVFWHGHKWEGPEGHFPFIPARIRPAQSLVAYVPIAVFAFLSLTAQYGALRFLSFTTLAAFKGCRAVVLLVAAAVMRKRLSTRIIPTGGMVTLGLVTYVVSQTSVDPFTYELPAGITFGALSIASFIFFDAFQSSGRLSPTAEPPSPVLAVGQQGAQLDQLMWTNFIGLAIAGHYAILSLSLGQGWSDIALLAKTPTLLGHVLLMSAASGLGAIWMIDLGNQFGAAEVTSTVHARHFISILFNGAWFETARDVGIWGWVGLVWASIGMYTYHAPAGEFPTPNPSQDYDYVSEKEYEAAVQKQAFMERVRNYLFKLCIPIIAVVTISQTLSTFFPDHRITGGNWDAELHSAISPMCNSRLATQPYPTKERTGLISFPRSGNSYIRSLVERSTGFQTSSSYCDTGLLKTFKGECDFTANYLVKSHYPTIPATSAPWDEDHYQHASFWNLNFSPLRNGHQDHEKKITIKKFGSDQRSTLLEYAQQWTEHAEYWLKAPIQTHFMRYENVREDPIPHMMSLLPFLLPPEDRPPLSRVTCLAQNTSSLDPYKSRKVQAFSNLRLFPEPLMLEIFNITRRPFCTFGYWSLLPEEIKTMAGVDTLCEQVHFKPTEAKPPILEDVAGSDANSTHEGVVAHLAGKRRLI
ncbi:hypothetical protein T439DRAFT_357287 [Meredithblackwellia eburnea MCA 4105]